MTSKGKIKELLKELTVVGPESNKMSGTKARARVMAIHRELKALGYKSRT